MSLSLWYRFRCESQRSASTFRGLEEITTVGERGGSFRVGDCERVVDGGRLLVFEKVDELEGTASDEAEGTGSTEVALDEAEGTGLAEVALDEEEETGLN